MFTSIIQYMLLSPSFINVINVYAFANTHDVRYAAFPFSHADSFAG
jgi:chitin synthase